MENPNRHRGKVQAMNFTTGKFEIMDEAEARTKADRQVMSDMAAAGYFHRGLLKNIQVMDIE